MKVRSIVIINNNVNCFNRRLNHFINKPSSKVNACTIKDSAIVKNHVDACTETHTLNNNEPCDNDNEASDNEESNNESSDNEESDNEASDNEASDNEPCDNKEKSSDQKLIYQVNKIVETSKGFLNNINKIRTFTNDLQDEIFSNDPR